MSSKTCDLDPISTSLLFQCMDEIALVLTDIVNECLSTGSVPDSLKRAIVKSLQNKASPDPNILKISDLCQMSFVSKLLEKLSFLSCLFTSHNNLWHAFQSARGSWHTLSRVFNDLLTSNESDHISTMTLLGLSAAFDTIDHDRLLNHLSDVFGIHDIALAFFESCPSGRN